MTATCRSSAPPRPDASGRRCVGSPRPGRLSWACRWCRMRFHSTLACNVLLDVVLQPQGKNHGEAVQPPDSVTASPCAADWRGSGCGSTKADYMKRGHAENRLRHNASASNLHVDGHRENLLLWLRDQSIPTIHAVIRVEDFDPTRRTTKWKDVEKLAGRGRSNSAECSQAHFAIG